MTKQEILRTEQEILNLAQLGLTKTEVAKKLKITIQTASKYFKKHNVISDGRGGQNAIITKNPFFPRTIEGDYWIGMLFADGWITSTKYNIGLKQGGNNINHMDLYSNFIGKPCYDYNDGFKSVIFGNKETYKWLEMIGIVKQKSLKMTSKIDLNIDILRGYFDGDGTVSISAKNYLRIGFTSGSKEFLMQVQQFLTSYSIESILFEESDTVFRIYLNGDNRNKLYYLLYNNATVFMERKKSLYGAWIKHAELKSREFGENPEEDNTEQSSVSDDLVRVTHSSKSQEDNNSTTSAGQSNYAIQDYKGIVVLNPLIIPSKDSNNYD